MPEYWELHYEKLYSSIATKLCANLLSNRSKNELFKVHDTIQWLNCVLNCLNMEIKWKLVEKINVQVCSSLKWHPIYKKVTSWDGPYPYAKIIHSYLSSWQDHYLKNLRTKNTMRDLEGMMKWSVIILKHIIIPWCRMVIISI